MDIELKQDIAGYLVFPFQLKGDLVLLNHKAIVPQNCLLAFATRGRVLDYLGTGEHVVHPVVLPNCNKKHKLQKTDKSGALPVGFLGYVYYINLNQVNNLTFGTYKKLRFSNKTDGKFWAKMQFAVDLKIVDADKFMKALLHQLAYLRAGECEEIVEGWISEFVTNALQSTPHTKAQFEKSQVFGIIGEISQKLSAMLGNVGLCLCNMRVLEVELPKTSTKIKNPLLQSAVDESYVMINTPKSVEQNKDEKTPPKWQGWEQFLGKK